ncbi:MAG: UDP-N-acetylmuramoyl-tripeptide--D-alanyl-D-alanine ligase [Gemmatimonadota bacterium]|nr:MAG: UDP-N-acetylmuramoyl-tripeptide--D-alanyl-D-alanine ligase [Gemmatimonadota bacterium]
MSRWPSELVARVLGVEASHVGGFTGVGTDTRVLEPGMLFVALAGEQYDGHDFLPDAARRGATGAVVRRGTPPQPGLATFEVEDPLVALGLLARERRRDITGPVVAVTGTNGKTATKEMLARAVGTRWRVHATRGNLNNLVGVPLTILAAPDEAQALVVEAGASLPGEVARLRDVIEPNLAVVTNVAAGHVEGFGSLEGVLAEKVELVRGVATAVVGTVPPALATRARELASRVVVAGTGPSAEVRPDAWGLNGEGRVELTVGGVPVRLPLVGKHQAENAMVALAVSEVLELDLATVAAALADLRLPPGRCEVLHNGDLVVLNDAYNANPLSLTASLETAAAMRGDRPLVVLLGSMLELGAEAAEHHRLMADRVMRDDPALVAVVGEFIPAFQRHAAVLGDRLITEADPATLGERVSRRLTGREFVLVKASRGVQLERAIPYLVPDSDTCSTIS